MTDFLTWCWGPLGIVVFPLTVGWLVQWAYAGDEEDGD